MHNGCLDMGLFPSRIKAQIICDLVPYVLQINYFVACLKG